MTHTTSANQSTTRRLVPLTIAAALAVAACGGSGDATADSDQTCRVAQRLIDDAADFDDEDIDRQLDRLADLDGIDDLTDLDDLERLVRKTDGDAISEAIDQLDDDLDCDLREPALAVREPTPATVSEEAIPPSPADTAQVTSPAPEPTLAPDTTVAPTPTVAPPPPASAEPTAGGAAVEIGATGPGLDRPDLISNATEKVAESGITQIPMPAGDVGVLEYDVNYSVDSFSESSTYSARESITFVAATPQTIDDVRIAFVDAIRTNGTAYEATDSTSTRDSVSTSATALNPVDFGAGARFDVFVSSNSDVPGVLFIEIDLSEKRDGELPAFIAPATENLSAAQAIGDAMGWSLQGWDWSPGVNQFSGSPYTRGGIDWAAGAGTAADVATVSSSLLAQLPAPEFEDIESDSQFYTFDDQSNWSVRFSDAYEGEELRVSYDFTL